MTDDKDKQWTVLESEYLIRRPWLTARRDKVRLPNGVENDEYYVLEYPDWVNVIALTEDGKFIMERHTVMDCSGPVMRYVPGCAKKGKRRWSLPKGSCTKRRDSATGYGRT